MKLRMYTDGACSKNPGPGGWGAIILEDEKCEVIGGNAKETTNNRMELQAVISALQFVLFTEEYKDVESITIYSDSAYVVNAINNNWLSQWKMRGWKTSSYEPVKNLHYWKALNELLKIARKKYNQSVIFEKVKGHNGNCFNEMADKEARRQADLIIEMEN